MLSAVMKVALSELLGAPVYDAGGQAVGRVREVAVIPAEDPNRISAFIARTGQGDRMLACRAVKELEPRAVRASTGAEEWTPFVASEGLLLLERDLLDQQIIDVHGRKVVRVNDVELVADNGGTAALRIGAVDVGARGAIRRLLKGVVPAAVLRRFLMRIPPRMIPWEFVDLIETDPARRVKLKISHERLARLHPADIADILEELAPAERGAVFETLDEEVAAHALEEVDPKMQVSIVRSLDTDHAADIFEEMHPDAAADLLGDLPAETSEEILEEMEPEEREEVEELLEYKENTAAGRMTTDFIALTANATVADAVEALRQFEGGIESIDSIFVLSPDGVLDGQAPLARLVLSSSDTRLESLSREQLITVHSGASEEDVVEIFDKYNLHTLPVVDEAGRMTGIITADDVITLLRNKT